MTARDFEIRYITDAECDRMHEQFTHDYNGKLDAIKREIDIKYEESLRDRAAIKLKIDNEISKVLDTVKDLRNEVRSMKFWAIGTLFTIILAFLSMTMWLWAKGGVATNLELNALEGKVAIIQEKQVDMKKLLEEVRQDQIRRQKLEQDKRR